MNEQVRMPLPSPASDESGEDGSQPPSTKPQQRRRTGPLNLWSKATRWLRPTDRNNIRDNFADALLSDAEHNLAFSPEERAMLHNILRLREVRVEDVMVPRADVDSVDQTTTLAELLVHFEESGHSRMPVYADHLDDPRGMVHIRDLLGYITKQARSKRRATTTKTSGAANANGQAGSGDKAKPRPAVDLGRVDLSKTVQEAGIIRKVLFVPPSMLASDLMERMQATRTQMALVIDEYGGTDGLVSLEDIVEMVVGDIADEHDDEEVMITRSSDDVFLVDAKAELEDIAEAIGPDFDVSEQIEDVDTLGGLIFSELGRIPARGELVQALPGFEFHVLDADPRRIKRVRIVRKRHNDRRRRPARPELESNAQPLALPAPEPVNEQPIAAVSPPVPQPLEQSQRG
ncbi:HlyC/CorC family transporter [Georhizobium profundi]|jgi:CBS domain containing-hemolysin-like protein|uniref:HlyC/CorC family transporter n=1 Tax=Georhizobium profundi TaxID=2341112 RepID=A0A3Q8XMH6_9HYPH|nr:HlyC/CorC family transporter [Georhizobium profundi]